MALQFPRLTPPDFLSSPWALTLTLSGILVSWSLLFGDPLEPLEMRWLGQLLRWRAAAGLAPAVDSHIIHVAIGDRELSAASSLEAEYRLAARIIREASRLGATVIAFDVIFDRGSEALARPILDAVDDARHDGTAVVLAEAQQQKPGSAAAAPPELLSSFPFLKPRYQPAGLINSAADADGILRHYALFRNDGNRVEPSLALVAYLKWRGRFWDKDVVRTESGRIRWKELSADFQSQTWREAGPVPALLNFRTSWEGSGPAAFRHYTVPDLDQLYERAQREANGGPGVIASGQRPFDHCIVVVAYLATGITDVGSTPLGTNQPNVLLHSAALNDLIQDQFLKRTSSLLDASLLILLLRLASLRRRCRGIVSLSWLWAGGVLLILGAGAGLILARGVVIGAVWLGAAWTGLAVLEVSRRYAAEFVARSQLRATMGLYFSPRVLERVLRDPGSMEAQEAELTLLLTDLRNSTPLAERLKSREMFALLNQVFEIQTRAVIAEDGSQEHFLGDQFLAYWGAPHPQADSAERALRATRALIAGMETLHRRLPAEVRELFGYGVALHHGRALVGNKGSSLRLDYGIVGDLANVAARIESLTKFYGVRMLVSREFYDQLTAAPAARVIDQVVVKGKTEAVQLLELWGAGGDRRQATLFERYTEAFRLYREGCFDRAEAAFQLLAKSEQDPPSRVLWQRCTAMKQHPPISWDGIYHLETK